MRISRHLGFVAFVAVFALSACSYAKFPPLGGHPQGGAKSLTCEVGFYQRGPENKGPLYPPRYQSTAVKSFPYALLASNVYADTHNFKISGWRRVDETSRFFGFFAELYHNQRSDEYVIVYRGTDQSLDWFTGNIDRSGIGQYRAALKAFDNIRAKTGNRPITVVGHSLGGGLALHVSASRPNAPAYVFNSSTRASETSIAARNRRLSVSENGDPLNLLRQRNDDFQTLITAGSFDKFNFVPNGLRPRELEENHNMYRLARGLLAVAASSGDQTAREVMRQNLGCNFAPPPAALEAPKPLLSQIGDLFIAEDDGVEAIDTKINDDIKDVSDLAYDDAILPDLSAGDNDVADEVENDQIDADAPPASDAPSPETADSNSQFIGPQRPVIADEVVGETNPPAEG